jgi:hypothetical protein
VTGYSRVVDVMDCVVAVEGLVSCAWVDAEDYGVVELGFGDGDFVFVADLGRWC